jgi:hypothetical protein
VIKDYGVPEGFHRGKWKSVDGPREGGVGSWSVSLSTLKGFVKVLLARQSAALGGAGARSLATHLHVQVRDMPHWYDLDTPKVFCRPGTNFRYRREPPSNFHVCPQNGTPPTSGAQGDLEKNPKSASFCYEYPLCVYYCSTYYKAVREGRGRGK